MSETHISLLSLSFLLVCWMGRTRNQKPVEKKEKSSQRKVKYKKEITPTKKKLSLVKTEAKHQLKVTLL